jgi:heme/copper-type cytochrome/quinol oxidase subunit 2
MIILSVISTAATFYQTLSIGYDQQPDKISIIDIFTTIISILLTVIVLFWFYRATKNINSFGAKYVNSLGMAVVWWFIPIMNLWKPYEVA